MADELKVRHASPDADPRASARPRGISPRPAGSEKTVDERHPAIVRLLVSSSSRHAVRLSALASARLDARS